MDKHIKKGIDVSQCEHYPMTYDSCNFTISGSCVKENCQTFRILQQLKAKEQVIEKLEKIANELADKCFPDKMQASYDCYGCCGCCSDAGDYTEELGNQLKELVKELKGEG